MPRSVNKLTITAAVVSGALLFSAGITACHRTQSTQTLVSEAKEYQQKGDNKAAIIQLKNAVVNSPNDAEVRLLLGTIYNDSGDPVSAENEIRKALSLGASPDNAIPVLAKSLAAQGHYQKVLDETQVLSAKNIPEILALRGDAYLALGKSDEAKAAYESALQTQADYPYALIGMARYSLSQKDMDAANDFAEKAIAKNSNNPDAWLFKGDLLRMQGKVEPSLAAYDQVLALKPAHFMAHLNKAYAEIRSKNFDAAKVDIDAARKAIPNNLLPLYAQALLDFTQGKYAVSLESLQKVLRAAPEHMPSILLSAAVELNLGSIEQAQQHVKKFLEKNPDNLYARKLLAATLLKSGQAPAALDVLIPALKDSPQDPELLTFIGNSYMQTRQYDKATEYFEKASALTPQAALLHTSLGLSELGQGDNAHAEGELELAASMDTKSTQAGITLVMTELHLKHYDKAFAAASTLQKEQPDNPLVYNLEGAAYMGLNDLPNARASFEKAVALKPNYFAAVVNLVQLDLREKKPDVAKKRFVSFLEKDKKNIEVLTALAGLASSQGQTAEATSWLEQAYNENPDAITPAMQLATQYLRTGQKEKALTLVRKLQVANPTNPDVLDLLAQTQFANDDKAGALETYSKLVNLLPNSALAQFRLATVHAAMKNDAAATEDLNKALALSPDYMEAQLLQAQIAVRAGNIDQAMTIARQLEKQHPKAAIGFAMEGDLYFGQKKPDLALHAYEQAFAVAPTAPLMIKVHSLLTQTGKGKEADLRMTQWQKAHPEDMQTVMYLSETHMAGKQYKIAAEELQTILKQYPKNAAVLNNLALVYQQENDPQALATAEQAMQLAGNNPQIIDTLGWILVQQGNTSRGLPLLQKAVALAPDSTDIGYHLASALNKSGDKGGARKELEKLLASGKSFPHMDDARALLKQL